MSKRISKIVSDELCISGPAELIESKSAPELVEAFKAACLRAAEGINKQNTEINLLEPINVIYRELQSARAAAEEARKWREKAALLDWLLHGSAVDVVLRLDRLQRFARGNDRPFEALQKLIADERAAREASDEN